MPFVSGADRTSHQQKKEPTAESKSNHRTPRNYFTNESGSGSGSFEALAVLRNSSTHGGQQNWYGFPSIIQVNFGFALVSVIGQIRSPDFGFMSCADLIPLNFCDAVTLPLATTSAAVYRPPGVR